MAHSTTRAKRPKPQADFPLFHHGNGQWAKKVKGKLHYFGKVADDPQGDSALNTWLEQKDDLLAGRKPRGKRDDLTVMQACNAFLTLKKQRLESGELTQRTFDRYYATCEFVLEELGKESYVEDLSPEDFQALRHEMTHRLGPVALGNEIRYVRSIFKYCYDEGLIEKPVRFGGTFVKPSAKTIRKARAANGPRMFTAGQIQAALGKAGANSRAFILLGINGGLGNTDIAELRIEQLDLDSGFLDYPRVKTGIARRIPLWHETQEALRAVLAQRDEKKGLLFIGRRGTDYRGRGKGYRIQQEVKRVLDNAGVEGRTFYDLRRTFQTVGEGCGDIVAVKSIMGHAPASGDMSAVYRQTVDDSRLKAVTDHIHDWLFGEGGEQ